MSKPSPLTRLRQRAATVLMPAALGLALFASGCTGTTEPRPATLLLIGIISGATPQLALVEDVTATAPVGDPRLVVVPGGARPLPAPAVAIDFEGRNGARQAAWVLGRGVTGSGTGAQVSAYLLRFAVAEIDPLVPTAFSEDLAARRTLTLPGGGGDLDGLSPTSPATCPTALQVSRDGSWAAVLDDPAACGLSGHTELWLIDTASGAARTLQGTNDVLALPPYLDQRPDREPLYFLVDAIGSAHIYLDELDGTASRRLGSASVPVAPTDLLDLAGSGDLLIALTADELVAVDLANPGVPELRAATRSDADRLVTDPGGVVDAVVVLDGSATAVHQSVQDFDPDISNQVVTAAAIDPVTRFAYGVGPGRMVIFDLLTGGDSGEPLRVHLEPIGALSLPSSGPAGQVSVIAWLRAAVAVSPP